MTTQQHMLCARCCAPRPRRYSAYTSLPEIYCLLADAWCHHQARTNKILLNQLDQVSCSISYNLCSGDVQDDSSG